MTTKELFDKIRMILIQADPIHIYFEDAQNIDEYDSEASMILDAVPSCHNEKQVLSVVWNIFRDQFSKGIAGPKEQYQDIARQIYNLSKEG